MKREKIKVLFVCLGNICRSPLAEGSFREHVKRAGLSAQFEIDSAGTGGYHVGESPDRRSIKVARAHGVEISSQRSRKLKLPDLSHYDAVIAMDRANLRDIRRLTKPAHSAQVSLFLDEVEGGEVPDPYYGGRGGFEQVWRLVDQASAALLQRLRQEFGI